MLYTIRGLLILRRRCVNQGLCDFMFRRLHSDKIFTDLNYTAPEFFAIKPSLLINTLRGMGLMMGGGGRGGARLGFKRLRI